MDKLTEKVARAINGWDLAHHNEREQAKIEAQAAIKVVLEELRLDLEAVIQIAHICRTMGEPWATDNGWKAVTNLRKLMEEVK